MLRALLSYLRGEGRRRSSLPVRPVLVCAAVYIAVLCALPSLALGQDRLERLEKEVEKLKDENRELKAKVDEIEAESEETKYSLGILSRLVDVSGYADVEYRLTGEDGQNNRFRLRHLSLFFTKDIQKEWKLFTEVEFEDAPLIESDPQADTVTRSNGKLFVEQIYIEYHPSLSWDVRVGRFLTPAGIWSIYHYPPYVPTQSSPLFNKLIFPEFSDGALLRNSFVLKDIVIDTHLLVANGSGNPGRLDRNENKGVGARVNAGIISGLSAGASYYREKDNTDVMHNSYGLHLLYNYGPFNFQTEYAYRHNSPDASRSFNDKGWYGQLEYDTGKWTLAGRLDWYDTNDTDPDNDIYRYTAAVNYHFAHNVVGKVEYDRNEFDDPAKPGYDEVIFAIVVAIGDL
ncbi:MAG: porin [Thermodesulfobacteriota bacterium]